MREREKGEGVRERVRERERREREREIIQTCQLSLIRLETPAFWTYLTA